MDKRNEIHYIRSSVYLRTFWEYRFYSSKFFCIILMKKNSALYFKIEEVRYFVFFEKINFYLFASVGVSL